MNEAGYWETLRDQLALDDMHRIENKLGAGMPDVFYMHRFLTGWMELKYEAAMPSRIDYRPGQALWLSNYWSKGGTCFLTLLCGQNKTAYFWRGCDAFALDKKGGVATTPPAFTVPNKRSAWEELRERFNDFRNDMGLRADLSLMV